MFLRGGDGLVIQAGKNEQILGGFKASQDWRCKKEGLQLESRPLLALCLPSKNHSCVPSVFPPKSTVAQTKAS